MNLFNEKNLDRYLRAIIETISHDLEKETHDYILSVNQEEYITHLEERYTVSAPQLHFEDLYVKTDTKMVPAEMFPWHFSVIPGNKYQKDTLIYHIPYSGEKSWFVYNPRIVGGSYIAEAQISDTEIMIEVVDMYNDPEKANAEFEAIKHKLNLAYTELRQKMENHNKQVAIHVHNQFNERYQKAAERLEKLKGIPYPMSRRDNISTAFKLPYVRKTLKPQVSSSHKSKADNHTYISDSDYMFIVNIIEQVGEEMERHPSLYKDKDEEALRDLLLMTLGTHFDSAAGEVFNKSGKTDIFIQDRGMKIFVGECKIWHGVAMLTDAIDQLVSYLTWRDSKAALILFIRNKDFGKTLTTIRENIKIHPNYKSITKDEDSSKLDFRMKLDPGDSVEFQLAVISIHVVAEDQ